MTILLRRNGKYDANYTHTMDREIKEGETVELVGKLDLSDNTAQFTSKRFIPVACFWGNLSCFDYLPKKEHQQEYATWLKRM